MSVLIVVIFFMGTVKWPPVDDFWGGQGLFGIYFGDVCVGGGGGGGGGGVLLARF